MGRWTVLIADDEPAARRGVRQMLAPFADFTVVGECRDGREVLSALDTLDPDVVFLDIQMPEVDEFAIRAFEAEALDYLLKPVGEERFAATIERLTRRLRNDAASIAVSTPRGIAVLPLEEIDWIEAADNYTRLWVGARSYLLRRSLAELEQRVSAHGFARAHRQALIRIAGVRALQEGESGELVAVLAIGAAIRVSRRRRAAFAAAVRRADERKTTGRPPAGRPGI
jgi:two-component system, LytTR family, response regulator